MDALRKSLAGSKEATSAPAVKGKRAKKRVPGQKEMLLPISGKGGAGVAPERKKADGPIHSPFSKGRITV